MRSGIWRGAISFGLINIPVTVQGAEQDKDLHFHLLDRKNLARIRFNRVNEKSGRVVPNQQIVKGYEYEKGKYVIMTDEDFKRANPKANQLIEIETFVELEDIDPMYFEKPYYLVPEKNGAKSYFLLQEALLKTKKAAIAKVVMHGKEHLICVFSRGKYLILEMLRFAHNLKDPKKIAFLKDLGVEPKFKTQELSMAQELIEDMTGHWDPESFKDTYYGDVMKHIKKRISTGKTKEIAEVDRDEVPIAAKASKSTDLMDLLRASLAKPSRAPTSTRSDRHMH